MKYAGNITIYDDQGDAVYERDLTSDEMIEALLVEPAEEEVEAEEAESEEEEPEPEVATTRKCSQCGKPGHSRRTCGDQGARKTEGGERTAGCAICGSKGKRHKNGCVKSTSNQGEPTFTKEKPAPEPPYKGQEKSPALTQEEHEMVKDARENDLKFSALMFADELGVDMREVNRAILTKNYRDYLVSWEAQA